MPARQDRRRWVWAKGLLALGLLLFGPLALLGTPLAGLARFWRSLLWDLALGFLAAAILGDMAGADLPVLVWLERRLRAWVAWFARDPEPLWLQWARQAHHATMAHWCLDRAVQLGGREAQFQEALAFLEGGHGAGGQVAGVARLRRAALRGHPEAAFRLAEALRTGLGNVVAEAAEAETWYQRSAALGFGPSAAWLARAYQDGDGVPVDEAKARHWAVQAERLRPHPELSSSPLRHDAGSADALVQVVSALAQGIEGTADRVVAHRVGRWAVLGSGALFAVAALFGVGALFWNGSAALSHLPLLMALMLLLLVGWQARQLGRDEPRSGRDRLLEAAEAGNPEACFQLGLAYRRGSRDRPKDDLSAALWFRKAAEAGHRGAMAALSEACLGGHGLLRDPREAARWAAAARGESTS